jgi:hypothetical protein
VTNAEVAQALSLSARTVRDLIVGWLADGWLEVADPARKSQRYRLSAAQRIGGISAK